jgi:peptide/nickel transport system substrate-binding protein
VTDLDPAYSFSGEILAMANMYETLLVYTGGDPDVKPGLAKDYNVSEDGLTWTFFLREGVKFHDGTPFNATAVKYSVERILELGSGPVFIWDPVEEINILNTYEVEFKLSYPAPLQRIVASVYGSWIYSPSVGLDDPFPPDMDLHDWFNEGNDAGTGPYMFETLERGIQVVLKRFDDYWGGWEDHAEDRIDKIILRVVEDPTVRSQMLETGEVHFSDGVPTEERKRLEQLPGIDVNWESGFMSYYWFLNTKSEYLSDVNLRKAITYAFPYEDWVTFGEGVYAKPHGPIPKGMWGHDPDLFQYTYDLTKAKEHLELAGHKDGGFSLKLTYISGVASGTAAEMWKTELEKIGVDLEITGMTWPSLWEIIKTGPKAENIYDICGFAWWPTYITPYDFLYNMWHTEESPFWNAGFYSNPEYDSLIDDAALLEGPDPATALEMYSQAQEILLEDCAAVFYTDIQFAIALRSNVKGYTFYPAYGDNVFICWEMWIEDEEE